MMRIKLSTDHEYAKTKECVISVESDTPMKQFLETVIDKLSIQGNYVV